MPLILSGNSKQPRGLATSTRVRKLRHLCPQSEDAPDLQAFFGEATVREQTGRHQSLTHPNRKISTEDANTAEITSQKLIVRNLVSNPPVDHTIHRVTESGNVQLIGTIEDDEGIIARDPNATKRHRPSRSLSMQLALRTIFSKQDQKAIGKEILFSIPSRALDTGPDVQVYPAEDGIITTVTMSAIHADRKLQHVLRSTLSSADTYSSISCLLHQENEKHNMMMDSIKLKIMKGVHPLSQQVEDLIGTIRSNKSMKMHYPLCDVVELSDPQAVEIIKLYPVNDTVDWEYNSEHQPAPILDYEEAIDQEKVSGKSRESILLSFETVSEMPPQSAEVIVREQYSFATESSRTTSTNDDNTHSYIEDTLDAINAYLRSDEHATDPVLSELDSVVEEESANTSNQTCSGQFQNMFDISDVSDVASAESYGMFQNEANDSVVGIMTTFVRYMLSGSEDRRSTKVQGVIESSIVVDSTNVNVFHRSLMAPCHNVDVPEKFELVQNIMKDSWGYRICSPTSWQGDHVDHGPSQLQSENFYNSVKYSPMKQMEPGAFTTSGSSMIKGLASAFIPLRSQAVNAQMGPYTDDTRYGIQNQRKPLIDSRSLHLI
ncbi:hypothetical protein V1508DRAFT_406936 [Lipomyces doorenjongii]|uniref:uncharacterized protein n=1 Tax=Lipomyces doorenjongii TaxID=383834 RepID=UPI0034D00572